MLPIHQSPGGEPLYGPGSWAPRYCRRSCVHEAKARLRDCRQGLVPPQANVDYVFSFSRRAGRHVTAVGGGLTRAITASTIRGQARPIMRVARWPRTASLLIEVVISALIVGLIVVGYAHRASTSQTGRSSYRSATTTRRSLSRLNRRRRCAAIPQARSRAPPTTIEIRLHRKPSPARPTRSRREASFLQQRRRKHRLQLRPTTTRQETNSLKLTSIVTWPQQVAGKRVTGHLFRASPPRPPRRRLEVDVGNYPTPTVRCLGDTHHGPTTKPESSLPRTPLSGTTEAGRLRRLLGAADDDGDSRSGRTAPGTSHLPAEGGRRSEEVTIAPNYTTHYPVTFNRGGAIEAEFSYNGSTEPYKHAGNR